MFERSRLHYSTAILATRPAKPKDKSPVEGAVKLIYKQLHGRLCHRVFFSLQELNEAIRVQMTEYNSRVSKAASDSRLALLHQVEQKELKPLPRERNELCQYLWASVQRNAHVLLPEGRHLYSVPFELIAKKVKVVYNHHKVEIYYHVKLVAVHKRDHTPRGRTTLQTHLPSNIQFVNAINAPMLIDWAASIGACTKEVITHVVDNALHFEQASKSCLGILQMNKKVGPERLEKACRRTIYFGSYSYRTIKSILHKNLDLQPLPLSTL